MSTTRLKKIFLRTLRSPRAILVATTLASYALGLMRDRLFAHSFGASRALDTYQAAFLLPDFILNFLAAGALSAVFVPLFLEILAQSSQKAGIFARTTTTVFALLMLGLGILLFIFASPLSRLVAPGFSPPERALLVGLMRVLAFSPAIFAISNALGGVLVAKNRFLTYGLAPVFYNGGIILGTVLLAPRLGIIGAAYGTILGAGMHLSIRVLELHRLRFPLMPAWDFSLPQFRPFVKLAIPKMFGHPVELATFWGYTAIASTFAAGSIATLNFARNFQSVPISLIGMTFATVSFSTLSQAHAVKDVVKFTKEFWRTLRYIAYLSLVAAVGMFLLRNFIIRLFLGGGAFNPDAVSKTATLLGAFMLSVPLEAVSHQLVRAFYATKNTLIPVYAALVNLGLSLGAAWFLLERLGIIALPVGYALGSLTKVIALVILLPRQLDTSFTGKGSGYLSSSAET